ncbi:MAG: MG2 domain-containing protein [Kofleriaceae bacterium]
MRVLASCALALSLWISCKGQPSAMDNAGPPPSTPTTGSGAGSGGKSIDAAPKPTPVTSKRVDPQIHELGMEHVVPSAIVIELATPIVDRDLVGAASSKSVVKLVPETAGSLSYTGVSELTFTPARPFAFGTDYTLTIQKLETRDGILEPPAGTQWVHTFHTEDFKFLSWAPSGLDLPHHKVTAEVTFSGPVLPNIARQSMTFGIDGKAPAGLQMLPSRQNNVVVVQMNDARLKLGSKLTVAIKDGLVSALGTGKAPAASAEYVIGTDKAVSLKDAFVVEGANGYYVEVVCDDDAAPDGHRYSYNGTGYYDLSARCQLNDEAVSRIHFSPPVKKTYITNGRAGFRIFGDFKRGAYSMKIDGGAQSVDGGVVLAPFSKSFSVAARKPTISFQGTGRYLPKSAWSNLGIKHLNVDAVNVVVREVPPENLIFWLSNDYSDVADERTSNVIFKKEIPLKGDPDTQASTWLDVASLVPSTTKGVLELKLIAPGAQATSRLLLTNMSLVAKKSGTTGKPYDQKVQVWALGIEDAEALSGVDVSLVRKSGKVVARCNTSGTKGCTLDANADNDPDQSPPFALIARKGDDLTYIRYQDLKADVAESSTGGVPFVSDTPYRAAMYSDRGVYRPGETAHVTSIIRDGHDKGVDQLPVDVVVMDPKAKLVKKVVMKTNAAGMIEVDQAFPAFADTGHWRVNLSVAEKPLAAYDVQVEEFVPERMKVTAAPKKPDAMIGDDISIDVTAQYLFGGTAADSGVELACSAEPTRFSPETNGDLTYGVTPKGKAVVMGEQTKDQLDPAGKVTIKCPNDPGKTSSTQTSEVTATASVLEAGSGRATVKTTTVTLHPEKFYIGMKTKATTARTGEAFTVEGKIVDWQGKQITSGVDKLDIELVHLEADYGYSYDEDSGEGSYNRNVRQVPEGKQTAKVTGGSFTFDVIPGESDVGYMVRAKAGKAKTELVLDGEYPYEYWYGYYNNGSVDTTPRPAKPTQLQPKLAKEIEVGKPVEVKVVAPYKGKVLWTVETDHVITAEWKDVQRGDVSWTFTLPEFAPNVYVSAFVVKDPHMESKDAFMPDRAFGIASARVLPTEFTQNVKLEVPKDVRSSSPLTVTVDASGIQGPAFATVAVVDEGVLSLTGFQTPNPLTTLFAKRALGVETYETIGWTMLHQPAGASSKTGGGGDFEADGEQGAYGKGRVQPVKPVALWSGVLPVGADGKVTIPFQIPSYRGQVRVMAIVTSANKIGRAEADVTVKDPLVVQVTFPRFVTQNDEIQIPVFITNLSGAPQTISIKLESADLPIVGLARPRTPVLPLAFNGKDTGTLKLENGKNDTVVFNAKAQIPVGGAKLRVVATAGGLTAKDELDVPFLPAGPKDHAIQKIKLEAGTLDLAKQAALKNWMPTSEQTTFWITNNPYGDAFGHLGYLIHYPYGCIEQTTSSTKPLLYIASLVEQVDPKLAELKIEDMVLAGITRVFSMETPSGGFGYWPGATEPLEWATAYATDFLLDAKKAGYAVPEDRLKEVLGWIDARVTAYERGSKIVHEPWNHYDEQSEAYLHYVLARAGRGKKARIQALIDSFPKQAKGEQSEDLYTLKAALYLAGDRRYATDLKAVDSSPIITERLNSWSFYSDRRRRGLMLSQFFELFGADAAGQTLADRVAESLSSEPGWGYYNTQELVWGITGLGKWVTAIAGKGVADAKLTAEGQVIDPRKTKTKSTDRSWALIRASEYKSLTLDVPAGSAGMWLVINSEGVRPGTDYKVGGNGMSVSRSYKQLDSTEVDLTKGTTKLGDLLFVEIEVENTSGATIQNIALVDRLPAGFEIENPRLGRTTKPDWVKDEDQWATDFMNMRDDRLEAFGTLPPHTSKKLVYTVRAVTAGKFTVPPIEAEAMYDATLWARAKGEQAVIAGPWVGKLL